MRTKKVLSLVLSAVMMLSLATTSFAANITSDGGSQSTVVTYGTSQNFIVTIPTNFTIDSSGKASANITASNVMIGANNALEVAISGHDYVDSWELVGQVVTSLREHRDYVCDSYHSFNAINNTVSSGVGSNAGRCDWSETVVPEVNRWEENDIASCSETCQSTCLQWNYDELGNQTTCVSYSAGVCRCTSTNGCARAVGTCNYSNGNGCTASNTVTTPHYYATATWTASDGQVDSQTNDSCSPINFGTNTFTHSETYDGSSSGENMYYQCSDGDLDENGYCYEEVFESNEGTSLTYIIGSSENEADIVNNSVILNVNAGDAYNSTVTKTMYFTVIDEILHAGTYNDVLTFTVDVVAKEHNTI